MARVTVEDCVKLVPNRFELVLIAAARSRQLASSQGRSILVERENDRDPVVALREIAEGKITPEELHQKIISDSFRRATAEEMAADNVDMTEEDMLQQLEAENGEINFNLDDDVDLDAAEDSFDESTSTAERVDGFSLKEDESVDTVIGAALEGDDLIGDEIGKAAEDDFIPSEVVEGEEETLIDVEEDEEMIGEAIETDDPDDSADSAEK